MFHSLKGLLTAGALVIASLSAQAQEIAMFGQPSSPYQGQRTFSSGDTTLTQAFYSKAGKTRAEMQMEGMEIIQIWRMDKQAIWSLMPQQGMAVEMGFGSEQAASPLDEFQDDGDVRFEMRLIGAETVNGVTANRYYISGTRKDGSKADGHVWTTPQNITVRIRMKDNAPGQAGEEFHYDLTNLILKDQPDSLFEVPAGYQTLSVGAGMQGMIPGMTGADKGVGGSLGDYAGDVAKDATNEAAREADRQVRGKARDEARKAIRKVLPW